MRNEFGGYDRETKRRLFLVNMSGHLAALSSISYAVNFTFYDWDNLHAYSHFTDRFDEATVLFADIVGFTTISFKLGADELVFLLNDIFFTF